MAEEMDFPIFPTVGQVYVNSEGTAYQWDGQSWVVGFDEGLGEDLTTVAGVLNQIRILLQDTSLESGGYRYSTSSIILCLNQCMLELYRLRPDIFMEQQFKIPRYVSTDLAASFLIEPQYIPPIIYYVVGLVQARDDEQTQDQRADVFLKAFKSAVLTVS